MEQRSTVEPLFCPFCEIHLDTDDVEWEEHPSEAIVRVTCPNCHMSGPDKSSDEEAIRVWNTLPRR